MHRRTFLNQAFTGGMVAALPVMLSQRTQAQSTEPQRTVFLETTSPGPAQSEQGVVIHPSDSQVMKGFPPPPDMLVTRDTHQPEFAAWRNQHTRELHPTQRIWRGRGPVSCFARPHNPENIRELLDAAVIRTREGSALTLKQYFCKFKISAFVAVKFSPSGKAVIVNEQYFNGMRPESVYNIYSGTKSLMGGLVGIAMAEGLLDPMGNIQDYIPELRDTGYHDVTLRQVLDMESGVKFGFGIRLTNGQSIFDAQNSEFDIGNKSMEPSTDVRIPKGYYAFLKTLVREQAPGTVFNYSNADPNVAVWAAEKAFKQRFADAFSEKIYQRLGPEEDAHIACDWVGSPAGGLSLSLRDWARWGELVLHKGNFRGEQIIPRTFYDDIDSANTGRMDSSYLVSSGVVPKGSRYRNYLLKQPDGTYSASGGVGQLLLVDPKRRHVIAHFSGLDVVADISLAPEMLNAGRQISEAMEQFEVQ
jgi:CubicO group peptidase (beta-lactamase class C family)